MSAAPAFLQIFEGVAACKARLINLQKTYPNMKMVVSMSLGLDLVNITMDKDLQKLVAQFDEYMRGLYARY
jgi:hypothetical protein